MRSRRNVLLLISISVLVGLSCIVTDMLSGAPDPTATPIAQVPREVEPVEEVEVQAPTPTQTEIPTQTPSKTPTEIIVEEPEEPDEDEVVDEPLAYYTEEFEGDLSSWSYFLMSGDEDDMDLYTEDGYLIFDLQGEDQWVYVLYDEYTYPEVGIELLAQNRGKNTNNVSLICNYSDREGWYEFNITNGGEYFILVYSELDDSYYTLANGGSKNVVTGRADNIYSASCDGNKLALYINGVLEREYTDNKYNLQEGQVGFSVSSFDVLPILVKVDYFWIGLP